MRRTGTVTVVFTDIVGSTELLSRLGERDWDDARRRHFAALRTVIADHNGTEVKNTGDGFMVVFPSAVDGAECAVAMGVAARGVVVRGIPIRVRVGVASGEATYDQGDWFGTPVVAAARLCALAGTGEIWATSLVQVLAGGHTGVRFVGLGPQALKGFDAPVEVSRIELPPGVQRSMYAAVDQHEAVGRRLVVQHEAVGRRLVVQHEAVGRRLVVQLDYWEALPSLQRMRAEMVAAISPRPGDVVCDIGCGTGSELIRHADLVGPTGRVIGVDPSATMLAEARNRTEGEPGVIELVEADGRATGLPDGCCDAVRIERVVQHTGDLSGLLAEAMRITRPGGRIAVADTDWGSLMIHPGDRDFVRRLKGTFEQGPITEPWAGRTLHAGMVDAGLEDVTSRLFPITADAGFMRAIPGMLDRLVKSRLATQGELDGLIAALDEAQERGGLVFAFTMFVASGRRP